MKNTQKNNRAARRILKNFFFNTHEKNNTTVHENKEYHEYLEHYKNITRWQTL